MLLERRDAAARLRRALHRAPVVLLTGPRQAGKTTLSRLVGKSAPECTFDAENPVDATRLADPMLALSGLSGLITIDEAQRIPDLFPVLRVLVDRPVMPARFLILGSASPDLVGLASESLAGRVELVELSGLTVRDVGSSAADRLWLRGVYRPRSRHAPTRTPRRGATATSPRFWSAISPSLVCAFRPRRCGARGRCSPTTMASSSAAQNLPAHSTLLRRRRGDTSMRSPMHSSSVS